MSPDRIFFAGFFFGACAMFLLMWLAALWFRWRVDRPSINQ